MKAWKKLGQGIIRLGIVVTLGTAVPVRAGDVNWSAAGAALTLLDGTTLDPAGSLILLGTFGTNDATIVQESVDPGMLFTTYFNQLESSTVGTGAGGSDGVWAKTFTGDFTSAFASFAGKTIYVWAFNAPTIEGIGGATQQAIFKFNATYPTDSPVAGTVDVDLGDLFSNGTVLVGGFNPGTILTDFGTLPSLHLAAIPEPSSFVLVFGSLLLAGKLRRRK